MSVQSIVDQVSWIKRPQGQDAQADRSLTDTVSTIIERVKADDDEALKAFSQQFDKMVPAQFEVTAQEIETALKGVDDAVGRLAQRFTAAPEADTLADFLTLPAYERLD